MKVFKFTRALIAGLFIVMACAAQADGTIIVNNSTDQFVVGVPPNNGAFYDGARYWFFYTESNTLKCKYGTVMNSLTTTNTNGGSGNLANIDDDGKSYSIVFGTLSGTWYAWCYYLDSTASAAWRRWELTSSGLGTPTSQTLSLSAKDGASRIAHDYGSEVVSTICGTTASAPVGGTFQGNGGATSTFNTSTGYTANTLHYGAVTRTGTTAGTSTAFIDGGSAGTSGTTLQVASLFNRTSIGALNRATPTAHLAGSAFVVLYSNSARSAGYVSTMHAAFTDADFTDISASIELGESCTSGSTGWVLFQSIAQTATAAADWANTADALVDDANTADVTLDEVTNVESEQLLFDNIAYGTTVPTDAVSYTVSLRVKRTAQTSSAKEINDLVVKFVDDTGTLVGDNLADTGLQWPSSLTTKDYTVTGVTFDGTEFDADTGMAISATGFDTNGNTLTEISVAWIKIDWVCDADTETTLGFFELAK